MSRAPIDPVRQQALSALFGSLSDGDAASVADLEIPGDPRSVARSVDVERLLGLVTELSESPRSVADPAALARALAAIDRELTGSGHAVRSVDATHEGDTWPARYVRIPPREGAAAPVPTVVLTAHYDTVPGSPGADDDASGVAAVLELARVLPRGTLPSAVVLGLVPFEEAGGLAGSRALAAHLRAQPDVRMVAAISAEMVGFATDEPVLPRDTGHALFLLGFPGTGVVVETIAGAAAAYGGGSVLGLATPVEIPELQRSDHAAFADEGVPAVMATDGAEYRNPHYHRASDTVATLDADFLGASTRTLAVGVMALAARLAAP